MCRVLCILSMLTLCACSDDDSPDGSTGADSSVDAAGEDGGLRDTSATGDAAPDSGTNPGNVAPECGSFSLRTYADAPLIIRSRAIDRNGDSLSVERTSEPDTGNLTGESGVWRYDPDPNFVGEVSFGYRASDATNSCPDAEVRIVILPAATAAVALPNGLEFLELQTAAARTGAADPNPRHVVLHRQSVRSPSFELYTYDDRRTPGRQREVNVPEPRTYLGEDLNDPTTVVSGVVDGEGRIYLSGWSGVTRVWVTRKPVDISDLITSVNMSGNSNDTAMPIVNEVEIPPIDGNKLYRPSPGPTFHTFLARVNARYGHSQWDGPPHPERDFDPHGPRHASGSLPVAVAHIESNILEANLAIGSHIGLLYRLSNAYVEQSGEEPESEWVGSLGVVNQFGTEQATDFWGMKNDQGAFCFAARSGINCPTGFQGSSSWLHELSHSVRVQHGHEETDSVRQIMVGGLSNTHLTRMQSRVALKELQSNTRQLTAMPMPWPMPPTAYVDYLTVFQGESGSVDAAANDFDANGDPLAIVDFSPTSMLGGVVVRQGESLRYTPPSDVAFGEDQFTYQVGDGGHSTSQIVRVMIVPPGDTLAGHWSFEDDGTGQAQDASSFSHPLDVGWNTHLPAVNPLTGSMDAPNSPPGPYESYLVPGPPGLGMALSYPSRAYLTPVEFGPADQRINSITLPHLFDPGHKSYSASIYFRYERIENDPVSRRIVFGKGSNALGALQNGGWEIAALKNELRFEIAFRDQLAVDNRIRISFEEGLVDGQWHHAALVIDRDANTLTAYLDGEARSASFEAKAGPVVSCMSTEYSRWRGTPLRLGDEPRSETTPPPPGRIAYDEATIRYRALTADEVETLAAVVSQ